MKKIITFLVLAGVVIASRAAMDFNATWSQPQEATAVEYKFTEPEVVEALKAAILRKYPNADTSSEKTLLVWHGMTVKGREKLDGEAMAFVWNSTFEGGRCGTNISLILYQKH